MPRENRDSPVYIPYGIPGESIHSGWKRLKAEKMAFDEEQRRLQEMRQRLLMDTEEKIPFVDEQAQFMGRESPQGLTESISMRPTKFVQSLRDTGTPEPMVQYIQNNPYASKEDIEMSLKANMMAQRPTGNDAPMSVKEWDYYSKLPEKDKPKYLEMKRQAYGVTDVGGVPTMAPKISGLPQLPLSTLPTESNAKSTLARASESGKVLGETETKAGLDLPGAEVDALESIRLVDELTKHPGLNLSVGPAGWTPKIPGTRQADFITRLEQLQGRQFMDARQLLKGGGQITDFEGKKAEQGIARMQRAQSADEFKKGAEEYKTAVRAGVAKLRRKAAGGSAESTPQIEEWVRDESGKLRRK
jgi:hypothetical protein